MTIASLEMTRQKLSAKIAKLERELSFEMEQLSEAKGAIAGLMSANKELEAHASHLITQALEPQ